MMLPGKRLGLPLMILQKIHAAIGRVRRVLIDLDWALGSLPWLSSLLGGAREAGWTRDREKKHDVARTSSDPN